MRDDYPEDTFTLNDVLNCLDRAGLKHKTGARYVLTQCPLHQDKNASAQIYLDDWFVKCHAGCEGGRFHITKAFPDLRSGTPRSTSYQPPRSKPMPSYKTYDLMHDWEQMPLIPRDHTFKNIPLEVLDGLGWRWDEYKNSYFIPYFSRSKTSIPFAQWRHLSGERRFTFLPEAKPTMYGTWNLVPGEKIFLVEGTSDMAVLTHCDVPAIAAPSASSGALLGLLAAFCIENDIGLIYAGDNDSAGSKLLEALDAHMSYRIRQPRHPYKDWCDMYEAEGFDAVQDYCFAEMFDIQPAPVDVPIKTPPVSVDEVVLNDIQQLWPGAIELEIVGAGKKQPETAPTGAIVA